MKPNLRAFIIFGVLAGCSSSTKVPADGSVPPDTFDSNLPPAGRDTSELNGDALVPIVDALAPSLDVVGPHVDDAKDGLPRDRGPDADTDTVGSGPDVPLDSNGSADGRGPLLDAAHDLPNDAPVEVSKPASDGGAGAGCIKGLFSTYIVRQDGVVVSENAPSDPRTVVEEGSGHPLAGIINMQEGQYHACAALTNGTAECWQFFAQSGNFYGQLGNGTTSGVSTAFRATPVLTGPATPLTNVVAVATSDHLTNTACAITSDTKLWCWGDLSWIVRKGKSLSTGYAQAITTDGTAPLTGVVSAALGPRQACAIVAGVPNTVWCWGSNVAGELGQGDTTARQYPTQVPGVTNPTKVVLAGSYYDATACVIDGGNVKCWGVNASGACGANLTINSIPSPTTVVDRSGAPIDGIVDIVPGGTAFAVLRTGGTMWIWGRAYQRYAADYGPTDVVAIGWSGPPDYNGPRFLTGDGVYHNATKTVAVNCGAM